MEEKNIWKTQEEKDAYFLKRKKRTKWIILLYFLVVILFVGMFIWVLFTLLQTTNDELVGTWDCDNGRVLLEIDEDNFYLYRNETKTEMKGKYRVTHYGSSVVSRSHTQDDWTLFLSDIEKIEQDGKEGLDQDTVYLSTNSEYKDQLVVEIVSSEEMYICERR